MNTKINVYPFAVIFFTFLVLSYGCNPSGNRDMDRESQLKLDKYFLAGRQLYEERCANCHQADGRGLARLYPPVRNADYILEDPGRMACIIKYGLEGPIIVNGQEYNMAMPAQETITNLEIAEIATYILNAWETKEGLVTLDEVRIRIDSCQQQLTR